MRPNRASLPVAVGTSRRKVRPSIGGRQLARASTVPPFAVHEGTAKAGAAVRAGAPAVAVWMQAGAPKGAPATVLAATCGCREDELSTSACMTSSCKDTGLCPSATHESEAAPVGLSMQRSEVDDDAGADPDNNSQASRMSAGRSSESGSPSAADETASGGCPRRRRARGKS